VLQSRVRGRVQFTNKDRLFFIQLYRWFPSVLKAMTIIRPETLVRWHRAGFRRYWRWRSRRVGGRPQIHGELRALIWRMSVDNRLWGAPHIHGELLKLGFAVAQSTVAKYMAKKGDPSGQSWGTFVPRGPGLKTPEFLIPLPRNFRSGPFLFGISRILRAKAAPDVPARSKAAQPD
jgi:hypothetical protein